MVAILKSEGDSQSSGNEKNQTESGRWEESSLAAWFGLKDKINLAS